MPSIHNQSLVKEQILKKEPTELYFIERSVYRKDVNTNNNWTFELGQSAAMSPNWIIVAFMNTQKFDNQERDNSIFDRLPIVYCVCKIGSEIFPENGINCNYDRDNFCEAYYEIENIFGCTLKQLF